MPAVSSTIEFNKPVAVYYAYEADQPITRLQGDFILIFLALILIFK